MKCLILAALIGFCAAGALYPSRQILWNDDNQVIVHGIHGNSYGFTQQPGQHFIDIVINGVHSPARHIQIDGNTCQIVQLQGWRNLPLQVQQQLHQVYQGNYVNHLFHILSQYQGAVNDLQFQQLLQIIHNHVEQGHVCQVIYHLLTVLDQIVDEDFVQQYIQQQHHIGVNSPLTGLVSHGFVDQQGIQNWGHQGVQGLVSQGVWGNQGVKQWLNPLWGSYVQQNYPYHYTDVHHYGVNPLYNSLWGVQQGAGVGSQWVHNVYPSQYHGVGTSHGLDYLLGNQNQGIWNSDIYHRQYVQQPWWSRWNQWNQQLGNNAILGY